MSTPFLSEIRIFSFNFPPKNWALCNGQSLPINQNQALFSLLGTTYGGNGQTTFALPDLQARVPLHFGANYSQGQVGGAETHSLSLSEMPSHVHSVTAGADSATAAGPSANYLTTTSSGVGPIYSGNQAVLNTSLNAASIANQGSGQPHENRQPYLVLSYAIALQGNFPSPN